MDGLLVDSERLERRVWQAAAVEHGIEMSDERFRTFVGHSGEECHRLLRQYFGDDFDVPAWRATCGGHMHRIMSTEGVALRDGAREWLRFVADLRIPLGLATSSALAHVHERLGDLVPLFSAVVTRAEVARGKPYPDIYEEAARRLGVAPSECLALEDSPVGARAALAAKMKVVVVPDLVDVPPDVAALAAGIYDSLDQVREAAAAGWGHTAPRA